MKVEIIKQKANVTEANTILVIFNPLLGIHIPIIEIITPTGCNTSINPINAIICFVLLVKSLIDKITINRIDIIIVHSVNMIYSLFRVD